MQPDISKQAAQPAPPTNCVPTAPSGNCENCGAPLYGKYCYACGQPVHGLVRHFGSIMSDIVDSVFNIDERVFKTLGPLYLRPGKLTLDYFAGRRARYVTPFRMVFFLAIIAFFAAQISVRAGFSQPVRLTTAPVAGVSSGTSSTVEPAKQDDGSFAHGSITLNDRVIWNRTTKPLQVNWLPGVLNGWLNELIGNAQQQLYQMNSGTRAERKAAGYKLVLGMFSAAPSVLFVLLPVFALLLKIFYIFKRRLYMEHLIVAMHSHAFLMLSMLVLIALGVLHHVLRPHAHWLSVPIILLEIAAWIWIFVYLWLMQKRVYRQGWFMTNVKYWSIGFCYGILLLCGFVFATLISLTGA
jgi:hypothetical protein